MSRCFTCLGGGAWTCVSRFRGHNQVVLSLTLAWRAYRVSSINFNPASLFLGDCGSRHRSLISAIAIAGSLNLRRWSLAIPIVSLVCHFGGFRRCLPALPDLPSLLLRQKPEHIHHNCWPWPSAQNKPSCVLYASSRVLLFGQPALRTGRLGIAISGRSSRPAC